MSCARHTYLILGFHFISLSCLVFHVPLCITLKPLNTPKCPCLVLYVITLVAFFVLYLCIPIEALGVNPTQNDPEHRVRSAFGSSCLETCTH
jgi:hypothetical protein